MARIHILTGMRPSEICKMRPCDIERRSDGVWIYRPESHKNDWRGNRREIPIVGAAQDVLRPYLTRKPKSYCFSPRESMVLVRQERHRKRKTRQSCGNGPGDNVKANPKKVPSEQYSPNTYRQTVQRAAKRAKVPKWTPYQVRHTIGTMTRQKLGVEGAQALLGHARADMTEHYARDPIGKGHRSGEDNRVN